jgi:hypothetical protein
LVFKNYETNANWFTNEAAVNLRVQRRSMQTVDGKSPFLYFDGATMMSYKYPSKQSEVVFCRREPTPEGCTGVGHGFDLDRINIPISALEVKQSSLGEQAGRGVFAKIDIPALSYVGLEKLVHIFHMDPSTYALARSWCRADGKCHWTYGVEGETMEMYIHGYGHSFSDHVSDPFGFPSSKSSSTTPDFFSLWSFCIIGRNRGLLGHHSPYIY